MILKKSLKNTYITTTLCYDFYFKYYTQPAKCVTNSPESMEPVQKVIVLGSTLFVSSSYLCSWLYVWSTISLPSKPYMSYSIIKHQEQCLKDSIKRPIAQTAVVLDSSYVPTITPKLTCYDYNDGCSQTKVLQLLLTS